MEEKNVVGEYIRFCKNSKINQVSKFVVDPRLENGGPSFFGVDTFVYVDTAIRRARRFIKKLGLNIDYATIPREFPGWEDSFSLWNDVKYSSKLNVISTDLRPTCRIFVEGREVARVSETLFEAVLTIDLTELDTILNDENHS